jgi:hypothetical protein
MTGREKEQRSANYRESLKSRSLDRFSGVQCLVSGHQFIVDDATAETMAEALSTKNPGLMKRVVGGSIEKAVYETLDTPASIFVDEWNEALELAIGHTVSLHELLQSENVTDIRKLRVALRDNKNSMLALETDSYVRLLYTVAACTLPKDGYRLKHSTNQRLRGKDAPIGLFSTAVHNLALLQREEPGLGMVREEVLSDGTSNPLDTYLTRLQKSETATSAIARIADLVEPEEIHIISKTVLEDIEQQDEDDEAEELRLHLLTWEILPHNFDDISATKASLKKHAESLAATPKAKERFVKYWDETRLDALFGIARQEIEKGRKVEIYISSAFNNSQEFYVAVEFGHESNEQVKIVIADNPMNGNAIYMVDEKFTQPDENGRNHNWQKVLGASKKIARQRGARRRFHVGEWEKLTENFCQLGVGSLAVANSGGVQKPEHVAATETTSTEETIVLEPAVEQRDMVKVLNDLDRMRTEIDIIYRDIIDKNL